MWITSPMVRPGAPEGRFARLRLAKLIAGPLRPCCSSAGMVGMGAGTAEAVAGTASAVATL
ncbi:hypothetical protein D3C72_2379910 [compost metagenome]